MHHQEPHPLGVKPLGNFYDDRFKSNFRDSRRLGLGMISLLSDTLIHDILSTLQPEDLISLSMTSKAFMCWAYLDEYWKHHTLRRFPDFKWHGTCWLHTFRWNARRFSNLSTEEKPIRVEWFYSDFLFQFHFCSTASIAQEWLRLDNIDRRSGLSKDAFIREYEEPNKPVIITDIVPQWKAFRAWNNDYLLEKFGGTKFQAEAIDITLANYFDYAENVIEESPFYLFDKHFVRNCPEIAEDFEVPEYFNDDLFSVLGPQDRPDYRWLILGPAKSGSSFHKDPNATSAWNATIYGRKKWILFPPDIVPPGVYPSPDGGEVTTPTSLMEWFLKFYKESKRMGKSVECITGPGDLIYVPSGWWHTVINLEMTLAITQNFVSRHNINKVMQFLREKKEQISGVDCSSADTLADRFQSALERAFPNENWLASEDNSHGEQPRMKRQCFWNDIKSETSNSGHNFSLTAMFSSD